MKPTTLLRIAAIVALMFAAGHTLGAPWLVSKDAPAMAVVDAMKSVHFDTMGPVRSYWDFYYGFGISISVYVLMQALMLWQVAGLCRVNAARLRPMMATLGVAFLVNTFVAWKYFFTLPMAMSAFITLCILAAWVQARRADGGL